jgi:acyl-ACP thioesterase
MENIEFDTIKNYNEPFNKINYGDLNEYSFIYDKKIMFSDLDHYGHMNNAKYLVILMDSLNLNKDDLIEEIQVDYINQGYKDHVLKVYLKKENNINYLVGKDLDNIIFVIKAKIKE